MNIVDLKANILNAPNVSIIAAATLPKSKSISTIGLHIFHMKKKFRRVILNITNCLNSHRLFDCFQNCTDFYSLMRTYQHVNMVGHENIGP